MYGQSHGSHILKVYNSSELLCRAGTCRAWLQFVNPSLEPHPSGHATVPLLGVEQLTVYGNGVQSRMLLRASGLLFALLLLALSLALVALFAACCRRRVPLPVPLPVLLAEVVVLPYSAELVESSHQAPDPCV